MTVSAVVRSKSLRHISQSVVVGVLAVLGALVIGLASTANAAVQLLAYTPIVMTGTFTSHPDPAYVGMAMNQYVIPSRSADYPPTGSDYHPPIALDTPEQAWPITGLFDYTFGTSVQIGLHDLQHQLAETQLASGAQRRDPLDPIRPSGS